MAQVTFNVRDDLLPEILDAYSDRFPRQTGDNKQQHMKRIIKAQMTAVLREYREVKAVATARAGVVDPGDIETA